jgi:hypothetical protein
MTERKLPLPGMAAISLWMLALALMGVTYVLRGHVQSTGGRIAVLILSSIFAVAGLGLIRLQRWGWALTLGAVFCSMAYWFYLLFHFRQLQGGVMAVVNLVFFLYLVRSEVIGRLR